MSPLLLLLLLLLLGLALLFVRRRRRRTGEPPLITGWIPFIGKALEFSRNPYSFLEECRRRCGDHFTVLMAGKYMTFIMDPLVYPNIIRCGRQLDFHEFSDRVAPPTFGYPPVLSRRFPGLGEQIRRSFTLLHGEQLAPLTESMMGNLMLLFRQDFLREQEVEQEVGGAWRSGGGLYEFCSSVMFEATLLTVYGRPAEGAGRRHGDVAALRRDFLTFDAAFPLLIARLPIGILGKTKSVRDKLISWFMPQRLAAWSDTSEFIRTRAEILDQYETLQDRDKAAHHFAMLWASVGNTVPATFWSVYYLLRNPPALKTVLHEILHVLQTSGVRFSLEQDLVLSKDQLDRLVYLESSISESLRLSSSSMNIRVSREDFSLRLDAGRSLSVRKDDVIALFPMSMHLDPEIYAEPQTFRFDRYVTPSGEENPAFFKNGQRLRFYLMPFGSGSSMCPGRHFALNEIKQFVVLLLLYFQLELEATPPVALDNGRAGLGVLLPANDVPFRYRIRTA